MEKIYSNTWNAAKLIDQQQRGDNLFDTAVDITADQINRATTLFKQGEAKTRSLAGGFGYVAADASQFVKNSVAKKDPAMQAAAGAGMGIAKVFGTMPFGITDLLNKTIDKASEGPAVTTATLAVSVGNGIVKGGANIVEIATGWLNGSLSKQDLFGVASEIAETTAAALFFVVGAKTFKGGASRIGNALFIEPNVGPAAVVAVESSISIDASATLIGGIKMSEGALMMSSTGNVAGKKATDPPKGKRRGRKPKATDEEIATALEKHGDDWNKAGKRF